jgi:TatA/E family protein of Tat protein translocase
VPEVILLFLESLGTTELIVILLVALVVFGPRKLPDLARSLGKSMNEFKRASDDFKRTWEREVALESVEREAASGRVMLSEEAESTQLESEAVNAGAREEEQQSVQDITVDVNAPVEGADTAHRAHVGTPALTINS